MSTTRTYPTNRASVGAWPWLMSEARSALPEAPVVPHVERATAPARRTALAHVLRRLADRIEPRYGPQPVREGPQPC
jgi:hypothetical protein